MHIGLVIGKKNSVGVPGKNTKMLPKLTQNGSLTSQENASRGAEVPLREGLRKGSRRK